MQPSRSAYLPTRIRTEEELIAAKKPFRELYVVELSMVEDRGVEAKMKALAAQLDKSLLDMTDPQKVWSARA
jgi:hypothetical protein